jgi:AcrR family transcriptional regulator
VQAHFVSSMKRDRLPAPGAEPGPARGGIRGRILEATLAVLREHGYAAASTNQIAARAKISKRELYREFGTKRGIFTALIAARAVRMREPLAGAEVSDGAALRATLRRFGVVFLRELFEPAVISVTRLVIAAAEESTEMPRVFEATAQEPMRRMLIELFTRARSAKLLIGEPAALARRFAALLAGYLQVSVLLGIATPPGPAELERHVDDAVDAFLQLHGAPDRRRERGRRRRRSRS